MASSLSTVPLLYSNRSCRRLRTPNTSRSINLRCMVAPRSCYYDHSDIVYGCYHDSLFEINLILHIVLSEAYSKSYKSAIRAEMINASSSTEDGSTPFTRQRSFNSRSNTMVNTPEFSPYFPQSPVSSQLRSVTFLSSSRNDLTCKMSEPIVQGGARKQTNSDCGEKITALSLDILRHTERLQSLLNSVEDNETLEIVSLLLLCLSLDVTLY